MIDDILFVVSDGFLLEQDPITNGLILGYSMDGKGFDVGSSGAAVTWGAI